MPFYLQMSKNITQQRDIYDTVIFQFLQIFYGQSVYILYVYLNKLYILKYVRMYIYIYIYIYINVYVCI